MNRKQKAEKEKRRKVSAGKVLTGKEPKITPSLEEGGNIEASGLEPATKQGMEAEPIDKRSKGLAPRQVALISKALADPTRMAILRAIARGGATCSNLRDGVGVSAATLSHHMKELEAAGLIETERNGRFVSAEFQRKTWKKYVEELKAFSK